MHASPQRCHRRVSLALAFVVASAALTASCSSPPPRLHYDSLALSGGNEHLDYAVYTPPGFAADEALPLVVFLHGAGDGPDCFDEAAVGQHLDAEIAAGRVPRAVIVLPRGDFGFWENWADGSFRYRDWVTAELMPEIAARYHTRPCPSGCHLIGISMGGHGALRFAFFQPDLFASVAAISAPILDTDDAWKLTNESWLRFVIPTDRIWGAADRESIAREDLFVRWSEPTDLQGLRLLLAWGDADHAQIIDTNERFDRHLRESEIPHTALIFAGRHEWKAWKPVLDEVLAIQLAP